MNEPTGFPDLEQALAALRETDAHAECPAMMEEKLVRAFRRQHARRTRHLRLWLPAALAACLVVAAAYRLLQTQAVSAPATSVPPRPVAINAESKPAAGDVLPGKGVVQSQIIPARRTRPRHRSVQSQGAGAAAPVAPSESDFIRLPFTPAMTQYDRGQVIRVNLPRSSIRTLGLPVDEDRLFEHIQADVLMGEDGIARGIRFVRSSSTR